MTYTVMIVQLMLVVEMFGLESCAGLMAVQMVSNLRVLGVPVRLATVSSTVSAIVSAVFIPSLGILLNRYAFSKAAKAKILVLTSCVALLGTGFVMSGNVCKLSQAIISNSTKLYNNTHYSVLKEDNFVTDIPYFAVMTMVGYALIETGFDSSNCCLKTFAIACVPTDQHADVIVKSALMSSIGGMFYCMLGLLSVGELTAYSDINPDASNTAVQAGFCLVVTLVCTITTLLTGCCCFGYEAKDEINKDDHVSPIDIRRRSRTISLDSSTSGICVHSFDEQLFIARFGAFTENRSRSTSDIHDKMVGYGLSIGTKITRVHRTYGTTGDLFRAKSETPDMTCSLNGVVALKSTTCSVDSQDQLKPELTNSCIDVARRHKKQIIINVSQFFLVGSLYAFEAYCTNFVSTSIYGGDPQCPVGSPEYTKFLRGVETSTAGVLVFYVSFTFFAFIVGLVLERIGCVQLMIVSVLCHVTITLTLAMFPRVWLYFVASVCVGMFRAVINTVPFILANQLSIENNGSQSTGAAIAAVSAMAPCAFALCSALMGPLMHATGNDAAPIYYSAVSGAFGLVIFIFFKPD